MGLGLAQEILMRKVFMKTGLKVMRMVSVSSLFFLVLFVFACGGGGGDDICDGLDQTTYHPAGWKDNPEHGTDYSTNPQNCKACHGEDLKGGPVDVNCFPCHHEAAVDPWQHGDHHTSPDEDDCKGCHGDDFTGGKTLVSCFSCHSKITGFDCVDCHTDIAGFGVYSASAHGNISYGVNRSETGYATGACTHCHDLSDPDASMNDLMLFTPMEPTDLLGGLLGGQAENFCFKCHKEAGSVQDPLFYNYNYSYMAGGNISLTCPDTILEAFSFIDETGMSLPNCDSIYGTSHHLTDIKAFIAGKWGYTADSNPCAACHNPHQAQRDAHADGDRGWLVSRPTGHADTSTWELFGDDDTETMKQYAAGQGGAYQAPEAVLGYEPDGSAIQDGSNLTDYVTFCADCHNKSNTIYSSVLDRNLYTIDWDIEKHGKGPAADDAYTDLLSPYQESQCGSYILACTDCHEPHGSPNRFLVRNSVNGGTVTVTLKQETGPDNTRSWKALCGKCHGETGNVHHRDPAIAWCTDCHKPEPTDIHVCIECHYHGNSSIDGVPYGEPLF